MADHITFIVQSALVEMPGRIFAFGYQSSGNAQVAESKAGRSSRKERIVSLAPCCHIWYFDNCLLDMI